jgi:hypothetical protein
MPRIIFEGFSKQKYSGNLLYQFVDTEQKYQINPQLRRRTAGLLYPSLLNKQPASSTGRLAHINSAVTFCLKQPSNTNIDDRYLPYVT